MERDFFGDLPSEIISNILSRLPIRSLAISKSVCKPWLNLIDSDDFHKSEIKTPPALAALLTEKTMNSTWCTIFEIADEDEVDAEKSHDLHYIPLTDSDIPHRNRGFTQGITANGLLLLYSLSATSIPVYICNLITREYTELSCPEEDHVYNFGFGVSKISGQYKVLCISRFPKSDSGHHLYTLGTGTWRRVEARAVAGFKFFGQNLVLNGNLHWIVSDLSDNLWICGFDVETECFRIFSAPPGDNGDENLDLSVLMDCLCCSYTWDDEVVIWMMKEYQVEDSWTMQYRLSTIGSDLDLEYAFVQPIKYFKDGDILMLVDEWDLVYYSNKTRTFQRVGMSKDATAGYVNYLIFTPSFFSLKNFGFENVISF